MADEARRERKQFEPPPWEKEAFEAFHARRAEQEAAERAAAEALAAANVAVAEVPAPADVLAEALAEAMKAKEAAVAGPGSPAEVPVAEAAPAAAGGPDDKVVAAMLLELSQQEAGDTKNQKVVAWVAAGVTAVLGVAMVIAGLSLAAKAQGQTSAVIGSAVLTVFGLIFGGMAVWVWMSSNRVRGR